MGFMHDRNIYAFISEIYRASVNPAATCSCVRPPPPLSSTQIKLSTSHALGTWRPVLFDYVFWMSSVGR